MNTFSMLIGVLIVLSSVDAHNILVIAPHPIPGQWLYFEEFIRELCNRGHKVSGVTSYNLRQKHENFTGYIVPAMNVETLYPSKNFYGGSYDGEASNIWMSWKLGLLNSEHVLKSPKVQELIKDDKLKFDLVISDHFGHESMFLFAHKFDCPLITIAPIGYTNSMDWSMGFITPWTFIPHHLSTYTGEMTFLQRCYNTFVNIYDILLRRFNYIRSQNKLAKVHFAEGIKGIIPNVQEMEQQVAVVLVNGHRSFYEPRPKMPGQIDITGAHVRPGLGLPADLTDFLNSAEHGVVVFSLGSHIRISQMPNEKLLEIIEAFKTIKQKVLWKFDGVAPTDLPPNVLARQWIPQSDVLAHPKVVLFITHGGVLSVQEALHRAVPMLFIPFLSDQQQISAHMQTAGCGLVLQFDDVTKQTLSASISQIIGDPTFKNQIFAASTMYKDKPIPPMDEAMFWVEYVARHRQNGVKHLKSPSMNMSTCKYFMIDVFAFYVTIFVVSFLSWVMIIKLCLRRYRNKEVKGKFKYY